MLFGVHTRVSDYTGVPWGINFPWHFVAWYLWRPSYSIWALLTVANITELPTTPALPKVFRQPIIRQEVVLFLFSHCDLSLLPFPVWILRFCLVTSFQNLSNLNVNSLAHLAKCCHGFSHNVSSPVVQSAMAHVWGNMFLECPDPEKRTLGVTNNLNLAFQSCGWRDEQRPPHKVTLTPDPEAISGSYSLLDRIYFYVSHSFVNCFSFSYLEYQQL